MSITTINRPHADFVPEKTGTTQLSKYKFLDLFTRTSPWIILPMDAVLVSVIICIGVLYYETNWASYWWLFPLGLFTWTLIEYCLHRFAFHFPAKNRAEKKVVYTIHLVHHHYPNDHHRLFQPPIVNLFLASLFMGAGYLLLGSNAFIFVPALIMGYMLYSFTHYSIHKFKPPFRFMKPVWRHHILHHYRYPEKAFGVSTFLWDRLFGTMPPKAIDKEFGDASD